MLEKVSFFLDEYQLSQLLSLCGIGFTMAQSRIPVQESWISPALFTDMI